MIDAVVNLNNAPLNQMAFLTDNALQFFQSCGINTEEEEKKNEKNKNENESQIFRYTMAMKMDVSPCKRGETNTRLNIN